MANRCNPLISLRRLRWLPRMMLAAVVLAWAQTAWLPCVMAAQAAAAADEVELAAKHCAYCPPALADASADNDGAGICGYPQSAIDVSAAGAQQFAALLSCAFVQPGSFGLVALQSNRIRQPPDRRRLPPQRSLNLTHCVQLK